MDSETLRYLASGFGVFYFASMTVGSVMRAYEDLTGRTIGSRTEGKGAIWK